MKRPDDDSSSDDAEPDAAEPRAHPRDPLHGVTLQSLLEQLHAHYGWEELGRRIQIRCFTHEPSIASALAFLRRYPWARNEVETLFLRLKKSQSAGDLP